MLAECSKSTKSNDKVPTRMKLKDDDAKQKQK